MTIIEILREARSKIASGWIKGTTRRMLPSGKVAYCAVGALSKTDSNNWVGAAHILGDVAREQFSDRCIKQGWRSIMEFNDHPATTQDDVLTVFDKAILKAEEAV